VSVGLTDMSHSNTLFVKEINYAQITGLSTVCPITWKITNYAQNYARA